MRNVKRQATGAGLLGFILIFISACVQTPPVQPIVTAPGNAATSLQAAAKPASNSKPVSATVDNVTASNSPTEPSASRSGSPVQIIAVHAKGTLSPLGCCDPDLVETDEFVAVRNTSMSPQDIRGWTLKNLTKGYPTFTFPDRFPCVAYNVPDPYLEVPGGYNTFRQLTPQTVTNTFTASHQGPGSLYSQNPVDWSQCGSIKPLDDSPLKPAAAQQGTAPLCILYPGQTVLVFTDEIHCQYGGLSFNYGPGDIWDNAYTDIAVLYDAQGHEVSRNSYAPGK